MTGFTPYSYFQVEHAGGLFKTLFIHQQLHPKACYDADTGASNVSSARHDRGAPITHVSCFLILKVTWPVSCPFNQVQILSKGSETNWESRIIPISCSLRRDHSTLDLIFRSTEKDGNHSHSLIYPHRIIWNSSLLGTWNNSCSFPSFVKGICFSFSQNGIGIGKLFPPDRKSGSIQYSENLFFLFALEGWLQSRACALLSVSEFLNKKWRLVSFTISALSVVGKTLASCPRMSPAYPVKHGARPSVIKKKTVINREISATVDLPNFSEWRSWAQVSQVSST